MKIGDVSRHVDSEGCKAYGGSGELGEVADVRRPPEGLGVARWREFWMFGGGPADCALADLRY